MDQPSPASWPPDFPKAQRLRILASERVEYNLLDWDREETTNDHIEWTAFTRYNESLCIIRDTEWVFQAIYQVNGPMDDPLLAEVILGTFNTYTRAYQALADYVIDHWGSYRAWEEQAEMEMAQEQTEADRG